METIENETLSAFPAKKRVFVISPFYTQNLRQNKAVHLWLINIQPVVCKFRQIQHIDLVVFRH